MLNGMSDDQAAAWLGALVSAKRGLARHSKGIKLVISSSDKKLIESVIEAAKSNAVIGEYLDTYTRKKFYKWCVTNDEVVAVIERIRPYIFGSFAETSDRYIREYKRRKLR